MKKKDGSICVHAKRRFKERVGIELDGELAKSLVKKIQRGELRFLKRQSNRITVWLYTNGDDEYKLYYDKFRKLIVTVYPIRSWFKEWLRNSINL